MASDIDRNLGEQPITGILARHNLKPRDLVATSTEQLTHKMIARAVKGRRLTPGVQANILAAVNKLTAGSYSMKDLFNY